MELSELSYIVLTGLITGLGTLGLVFLKQMDNNFKSKVDDLMNLYEMSIEETKDVRERYIEVGHRISAMEPRIKRNEEDIKELKVVKK